MVKLHEVQAANRELITTRDLVCVVSGGTSGIGETTLQQLAKLHGSEPKAKLLRVYILARKPEVAKTLITGLSKASPKAEFIFVVAAKGVLHDLAAFR